MKKKKLDRFDKTKDTIKMEEFVIQYLNDGHYVDCNNLTHKHLKSFDNPYVLALSFEFVSANIELVFTNKILLVSDCHGDVAPYINPQELRRLGSLGTVENQITELKKVRIYQLSELINLWGRMQMLLYEKEQIEGTIEILNEINRSSKVDELGGKRYVKKYQRR